MRVIALLAAYNEERFIGGCLEHLFQQGVEVYLIDNESTDATRAIAERYAGHGLIGIETLPRAGVFSLRPQLRRKEELAVSLEADWFIHVDADEIRLAPRSGCTLAQAFEEVEAQGYNAVNFMEFTFIPTQEAPDHDHPDFQKSMRWYYPFLPSFPHGLKAWQRQADPVQLAWSGGHKVRFPGLRMYPVSFPMRHYLFLSRQHAIHKFSQRGYDSTEARAGWHGWRQRFRPEMIKLPRQAELRTYVSDDQLDPSNPRSQHYIVDEHWADDLQRSILELDGLIPSGDPFILVDEDQWGTGEFVAGRRRIPFLERDGRYWGPPPDDATAISELERLQRAGASFIVFAGPAFWWLDYYSGFSEHLRSRFRCVRENDDLVVFDIGS